MWERKREAFGKERVFRRGKGIAGEIDDWDNFGGGCQHGWWWGVWNGVGEGMIKGGMGGVRAGKSEFTGTEGKNVKKDGEIEAGGKGRFATNDG